jgi:hypothetical protein
MVAKKRESRFPFGLVKIIAVKEIYHSRNDPLELIGSRNTILLTKHWSTYN